MVRSVLRRLGVCSPLRFLLFFQPKKLQLCTGAPAAASRAAIAQAQRARTRTYMFWNSAPRSSSVAAEGLAAEPPVVRLGDDILRKRKFRRPAVV